MTKSLNRHSLGHYELLTKIIVKSIMVVAELGVCGIVIYSQN